MGRFEGSGIDVDAKFAHEIAGVGRFSLILNGEYNTKVSGQFDGVNESSILGATSVEGLVVPRWRSIG
jgi:hypothetical protein